MNEERHVKIVERADHKWDWHMIATHNGEETFATHQGFTDAGDASRSLLRELEALHVVDELHVEVIPLAAPETD